MQMNSEHVPPYLAWNGKLEGATRGKGMGGGQDGQAETEGIFRRFLKLGEGNEHMVPLLVRTLTILCNIEPRKASKI